MDRETLEGQVAALGEGRAVLDLETWRPVEVSGRDAEAWLEDLVTASVVALEPGRAVRSLLLSPTGRIRADFRVARTQPEGAFILLQGPGQPDPLEDLLAPYVLSSDVALEVVRTRPTIVPKPGPTWEVSLGAPEPGRPVASREAFEAWRIRTGVPDFPRDLDEDSLAAEGGLDLEPVIDRSKGCYLGQEAVARVRNLGHPPRIVLTVWAEATIRAGAEVRSAGGAAGLVTSVDAVDGRSTALVRVRWSARHERLTTEDGASLVPR